MDIAKAINIALVMRGMTQKELAARTGYTSGGLYNYLRKGSFKVADLETFAEVLGYRLRMELVDIQTGKVIDCE